MKFEVSEKKKGILFIAVAAVFSIIGVCIGSFSHYFIAGTVGMFLMFGIMKLRK